eukprot:CAMPEP_0178410818 /NCGR_PEP_ID=MMETSP0689_2-20121128/21179_1 /TAXON_ID=160604 /ORGANISM="Amphidinium massartii, Strain CS-259" /LENGTH=149 /DNA_ID=CAMNT_0020032013 /DNA_START=117 /DNA_END=566 /DNA_ORIENTATION=-
MSSTTFALAVLASMLGAQLVAGHNHMTPPAEGMQRLMCLNETHYAMVEMEHDHDEDESHDDDEASNETAGHSHHDHEMHHVHHVHMNTAEMNPCNSTCSAVCNATACMPAHCDVPATSTTEWDDVIATAGSIRAVCTGALAAVALRFML